LIKTQMWELFFFFFHKSLYFFVVPDAFKNRFY